MFLTKGGNPQGPDENMDPDNFEWASNPRTTATHNNTGLSQE